MPELAELCARAVEEAKAEEEIEAFAESGKQVQVRVRGGEVESLTSAETRGLGVRAVVDGRVGYAYGAGPSPDEVAELVRSARESATFAEPDDANGLPDLAPVHPMPEMYRASLEEVPAERKVSLALDLERAATSASPDVR